MTIVLSNPKRMAARGMLLALVPIVVASLAVSLTTARAESGPVVSNTITIPTADTCADQTTGPYKVVISADNAYAYVTLNGDGRVAKIDTATDTVVGLACTGDRYPEHVAISPDSSLLYVTNSASENLRVLNAADMSTVADLSVGYAGNGVEVVTTPESVGKVYVYRHLEGSLVVIDATDNSIDAPVFVGASNTRRAMGVALSPDGSTLYVLVDAGIAVISTATDSVTSTIPLSGAMGVAVAPDGSFLYVIGGDSDNSLFRVKTSDGSVEASTVIGAAPSGVAITPDGTQAIVSLKNSDSAVVIDTTTNSVTHTLSVGDRPYGVAIAPNGTFAYVANWGGGFGDTMSRITLAATPAPVASAPSAPGLAPPTATDTGATLKWSAPASDGGSAITDYEYELDASGTWSSLATTGTSATISDLTDGVSYSVRIRAVNAVGEGTASNARTFTVGAFCDKNVLTKSAFSTCKKAIKKS
jgi:YVTN family beta-propeller protein